MRVDLYLEQLQRDRDRLPAQVHHLVADGTVRLSLSME
jgi:hypothetical protein